MFWVELFIDKNHIIEETDINTNTDTNKTDSKLQIRTHRPTYHSVIFKPKDAWDNHDFTTYFNITPFKGKYYMYYRGNLPTANTNYHNENTCVLVSEDGYKWTKPNLSIFLDSIVANPRPKGKSHDASQMNPDRKHKVSDAAKNNVVWKSDAICHNFYAFENRQNPNILNAIGGLNAASCHCCAKGIHLLSSEDGFNWKMDKIILTLSNSVSQGYGTHFDSLNTVVWDAYRKYYRTFLRFNYQRGIRDIQTQFSYDLKKWEDPSTLYYNILYEKKDMMLRCYYMSNIWAHPNNGYFIGFPSGQSGDYREQQTIDLMVSRDGVHWDVLEQTWLGELSVHPERMVPYVILDEVKNEYLLYVNDARTTQVKMYTLRRDGFTSLATSTPDTLVTFKTHEFWLNQDTITFNYKVEASGSLTIYLNDLPEPILDIKGPSDNSNHVIKCGGSVKGKQESWLKIKMMNAEIFSYSYHTDPEKVTVKAVDSDLYHNIAMLNKSNNKNSKKAAKNKESKEVTKPQPAASTVILQTLSEVEAKYVGIDKNLEVINKVLAAYPTQEIKYVYTDLSPMHPEGSKRVYKCKKPVKQITKAEYANHNISENGSKTFGRIFMFTTLDIDDQSTVITLINNFRSNCIVEFI